MVQAEWQDLLWHNYYSNRCRDNCGIELFSDSIVWIYGQQLGYITVLFFMAMICYALGQKYFPVPYKLLSEFGYLILTWSLILISGYVTISNQVLATSFHALVILFFLAVVFMFEKNYWRSSVD